MSVKIRLARTGSHKKPFYRIVAASSEKAVQKKFIEIIGTYNPCAKTDQFSINRDKFDNWVSLGATPSDTVISLIKKNNQTPSN